MSGARRPTLLALACVLLGSFGCAHGGFADPVALGPFSYFEAAASDDPWSPKIAGWQSRELAIPDTAMLAAPASVSGPGGDDAAAPASPEAPALRDKYFEFRRAQKRAMALEVAAWIQTEARHHYFPDGAVDHWATLEETLDRGGDDCDGLELLVYHFLRDLGFDQDEVFRAIVVRPSDGQHHMVTLWFEEGDDPWVIDPTGAMTSGMPRMSDVPGWVPLKVFSETREFTAEPLAVR